MLQFANVGSSSWEGNSPAASTSFLSLSTHISHTLAGIVPTLHLPATAPSARERIGSPQLRLLCVPAMTIAALDILVRRILGSHVDRGAHVLLACMWPKSARRREMCAARPARLAILAMGPCAFTASLASLYPRGPRGRVPTLRAPAATLTTTRTALRSASRALRPAAQALQRRRRAPRRPTAAVSDANRVAFHPTAPLVVHAAPNVATGPTPRRCATVLPTTSAEHVHRRHIAPMVSTKPVQKRRIRSARHRPRPRKEIRRRCQSPGGHFFSSHWSLSCY